MRFKHIFTGFPWKSMVLLMEFLWDSYGIPLEDFHGILLDFYDSKGFYGISMMFL